MHYIGSLTALSSVLYYSNVLETLPEDSRTCLMLKCCIFFVLVLTKVSVICIVLTVEPPIYMNSEYPMANTQVSNAD